MKNLSISLLLAGAILLSAQSSFAAWEGMQSLNPMPYISYANPLPYIGIGENRTNFSLNPFTGFKNCNKCKVQKIKCDECTRVTLNTCPTCTRAFPDVCDTCEQIQPRCSSCMQNNQ